MMIVFTIEVLLYALLTYLVITQVILPLITETEWFPMLKRKDVHEEVVEAAEEVEVLEERLRAAALHKKAQTLRDELESQDAVLKHESGTK